MYKVECDADVALVSSLTGSVKEKNHASSWKNGNFKKITKDK